MIQFKPASEEKATVNKILHSPTLKQTNLVNIF